MQRDFHRGLLVGHAAARVSARSTYVGPGAVVRVELMAAGRSSVRPTIAVADLLTRGTRVSFSAPLTRDSR
jgi:hypothetical protein